ncbi:MAG TPA: hypothetical protein PK513_06855 [Alphaproteobacteria bacterium]|nr:hypothetical protein [Alphaproteobacteria bacterium]USO05569.1 MAG: hypothetical protein H6859_10680 [Rhodospirillales bacterium]HOO82204.1 hypothetical protein [Alphaproteobacteria bacterium]
MPTILPKDADNIPLPALRLKDNAAHAINVTASSARNINAFDTETKIVSLYATGPVYLKFGGASVTATTSDHYFPEGVYYDISIGDDKTGHLSHVAAIRASSDCQLFISEKH